VFPTEAELATMPISSRTPPQAARCVDLPEPLEGREHQRPGDSLPDSDVAGIVLVGSHHWGDGTFERVLRGPLLPVAHTPVICYALAWLRDSGVHESVVCANSSTAAVQAVLGDGAALGLKLDYFEDREPRGPAGCAHDAARRSAASIFVIVEGTLIPSLDLRALLRAHRESRAAATVVVEVERRQREGGRDRPRVPGGVFVFDRRVLEQVTPRGYQDIKQGLLERLYAAGERVAVHEVPGLAPRVLDYATYSSVNQWLITRAIVQPGFLADYQRIGESRRHPSAIVHPSARLVGPVLLGPRSRVEEGAVIVGPASVGADSVIGAGALVSRSIIWDQCVVGAGAMLESSLFADDSLVAPRQRAIGVVHIPTDWVGARRPMVPTARSAEAEVTPADVRATPRGPRPPVMIPRSFKLPFGRTSGGHELTDEHPACP
jgi:NDP-sugar pyrophosphorylase family protein